jgi:hypothetical protein
VAKRRAWSGVLPMLTSTPEIWPTLEVCVSVSVEKLAEERTGVTPSFSLAQRTHIHSSICPRKLGGMLSGTCCCWGCCGGGWCWCC